ncbi:MAG: class C beta-lactamase-related serine hydrolase [Chitinophagaceae bacterium]|nr:MAG: class C beta-lactamase-related serine hydrolase [Chitinophagaceae bacterium]
MTRTFSRLLVLLCIVAAIPAAAQSLYFPDTAWQVKAPAEVGMNAALVDSAVRFALRNDSKTDHDLRIANMKAYAHEPGYRIAGPMKERGGPAGLIIRRGYIVAQWGDLRRVDMTFSVAKSYLSTVAGLAVDAGLIRSVDEPVGNYVTEEHFTGPHNAAITWRHLLTQSSDWSGCLFDVCDWADRPPRTGTVDDWKARKLLEPGTNFEYNDVRVNLLAYSLLQVWRRPLPSVFRERLMDPIGASITWRWYGYDNSFVNVDGQMVQSVSGGGHFGGGLFINTYDQARFGLLFLRKGRWKGTQLLSERWIAAARQPSAANKEYGFLWWLNDTERWKGVPKNIYYANGFGGNYIVIDEAHDLLLVTRWLEPSAIGEFVKLAVDAVERK